MRSKRQKKTRKVIFDTPGRECPHADKGCCPRCLNPMSPFKNPARLKAPGIIKPTTYERLNG